MVISDTHARGLAKDFLNALEDDVEEARELNKKKLNAVRIRDRHDFAKYAASHQQIFKKFLLSSFVGGSKRSPYLAFVGVVKYKDRVYEDWTEPSISGVVYINALANKFEEGSKAIFMMGEHALKRVFERSGIVHLDEKYDRYCLVKEIRFLPLWAGFWHLFLRKIEGVPEEIKSMLSPAVPTPNGLLLCKLTSIDNHQFLEVRTYIHESNLSEMQKVVREKMLEATKGLESSLLCVYPYHYKVPNFNSLEIEVIFSLMSTRLKDEYENIGDLISREIDTFKAYQLSKHVRQVLCESSDKQELYEFISEKIQKIGYRETINQVISDSKSLYKD